jgi:hypothetical protein
MFSVCVRSLLVIAFAFISFGAAPEEMFRPEADAPDTTVSVVRGALAENAWILEIALDYGPEDLDGRVWSVEVFSGSRMCYDGSITGRVGILELPLSATDQFQPIMIAARINERGEFPVAYSFLQPRGQNLVPLTLEQYLWSRSTPSGDQQVFHGSTSSSAPPEVVDTDAEFASTSGALSVAQKVDDPPSGCNGARSSLGSLSLLLIAFLLLLIRRRRAIVPLGLLLLLVAGHESNATIVKGYVAFWDSRLGSNLTGSNLLQCDVSNVTCEANTTNCCTRGIPKILVLIGKKGSPSVATTTSDMDGHFQFPDSTYGPGEYQVIVSFVRGDWPSSQYLTTTGGYPPIALDAGLSFPVPSSGTLDVHSLRVNLTQDTNSQEGNMATIWHATTMSFFWIEAEGESRHRKVLGSPNAYDQMTIHYTTNDNLVCPSLANVSASNARLINTHYQAGYILQSRSMGCVANLPRFPAVPFTVASGLQPGSEAVGLQRGISRLVALLSRFFPQTSSIASVKSGTSLDCFYDTILGIDYYPNSNSAAWPINDAFALWDLIDADTSGSDDGVADNVDTTLKVLIDALYANSLANGSAGQNRTFQEFTATNMSVGCSDNEGCGPGECCMKTSPTCHSGDTSGGNIGDLAYFLQLQGVSGNIPNTIKSSACMKGAPDQTHPFNGSYRDD